jgi:release factor glutamine methyltransferase
MTSVRQALLAAHAMGVARLDAQMLCLHACGRDALDRAWLLAHESDPLSPEQSRQLDAMLARRAHGEPVAYITGFKEFFGLRLSITPAVLDPRDDTETLVQWALELSPPEQAIRIVDLGTGSGAVALALKSQRPLADISATDASAPALAVARRNGEQLGLTVRWVLSDAAQANWFASLATESFDLIVSNPPYIAEGDPHLRHLQHEPALALTSGADGLDAVRSIVRNARQHLRPGGHLLLEHGHEQAAAVRALLQGSGYIDISSRADLSGIERCTGGRWPAA